MPWPEFFISMAPYAVLMPAVVALSSYRRLGAASNVMAFYVLLDVFHLVLSSIGDGTHWMVWIEPYWHIVEFVCIAWFYSMVLRGVRGVAVIGVCLVAAVQSTEAGEQRAMALEGILVIVFGLTWCYKTLAELRIRYLERDPVFWINTGFLLYFSGNLLLFFCTAYLPQQHCRLLVYLSGFEAVFIILKNCFVSMGLWKDK